ncbi:hypothetical protein MSG28_004757 [Choristoneura fumiferana]|uniref:Uncharacterized protein n=2 Tax=Choristoneura fumiferana TaxID=7141 RepID=A0ACC0K7F2_CHOFU|nr:hypothetical protein MSG28_004757 [Choristoneura fumiferana]
MSQPTHTLEPVEKGDEENIMKLLKKTFFIDEPLNAAVGLITSENDTCIELEEYCTHSLKDGLSFKAVDSEHNIVGVMISGIMPLKEDANGNDLLSQAQRCKNPKFKKILYILARREAGARLWEKYPEEQHLVEIMVAATDPGWRRRGIMNDLLNRTEQATAQRGIRLIRLDTSSAYSAMAAERFGYTNVYKALYTDIKMDGRPILVPEPPHVDDRVNIKKLFD